MKTNFAELFARSAFRIFADHEVSNDLGSDRSFGALNVGSDPAQGGVEDAAGLVNGNDVLRDKKVKKRGRDKTAR